MRTATLVGLASIPVGFLWIYLFGTQSAAVLLATGIVVGAFYSDHPTPTRRAGARAGLFAPIPELTVQTATNLGDIWQFSASPEFQIGLTVAVVALLVPVAWVLFVFFVIGVATGTAWMLKQVRPYLSNTVQSHR